MGFISTLLRASRPALSFLSGESLGSRSRDAAAWALTLFAGALLIASGLLGALMALALWLSSFLLALVLGAGAPLGLLLGALWLARSAAARSRRPGSSSRSTDLREPKQTASSDPTPPTPCLPQPKATEPPEDAPPPAEPVCPRCGGSEVDEHAPAWVETRVALIDERGDTGPAELDLSHVHYRDAGRRLLCAAPGCGFETEDVFGFVPGRRAHVEARAAVSLARTRASAVAAPARQLAAPAGS